MPNLDGKDDLTFISWGSPAQGPLSALKLRDGDGDTDHFFGVKFHESCDQMILRTTQRVRWNVERQVTQADFEPQGLAEESFPNGKIQTFE